MRWHQAPMTQCHPQPTSYLAWHQVADRDEGGVGELQDAEHLAGHDVQGQAWHSGQAPCAALRPALCHCGTGRAAVGQAAWAGARPLRLPVAECGTCPSYPG